MLKNYFLRSFILIAITSCSSMPKNEQKSAPLIAPFETDSYIPGPGFEKYVFKSCPKVDNIPLDLDFHFFYSDADNSIIDPFKKKEFDNNQKKLQVFAKDVTFASNSYLYLKSSSGAVCAAKLLVTWAKNDALLGNMSTDPKDWKSKMQAKFVRKWLAGELANAYLKIRKSPDIAENDRVIILSWFRKLVGEIQKDYLGPKSLKNNHATWAGVSVMMSAIVLDDRKLFEWSLQKYHETVDQIQTDGTLPLEIARKGEALHYHHWTLTALSILANYARANGIDLLSYRDHKIDYLEKILIPTLSDPDEFMKITGLKPARDLIGSDRAWVEYFYKKNHNPEIKKYLIAHRPISEYWFDFDMTACFGEK